MLFRSGWACGHDAGEVAEAMRRALAGTDRPDAEHLREWTLANASLAGCAAQAADAVLGSLPAAR